MRLKLTTMSVLAGCMTIPVFGQSTPSGYGQGMDSKISCNRKAEGSLPSINAALKSSAPAISNTVTVSGTCNENLLIQGFTDSRSPPPPVQQSTTHREDKPGGRY